MSAAKLTDAALVDTILGLFDRGTEDAGIVAELSRFNVDVRRAEQSIDVVRTALARAAFLKLGMGLKQFGSRVDQLPLFPVALAAANRRIAAMPARRIRSVRELAVVARSSDESIRRIALYELGRTRDRSAVPILIAALDDLDVWCRVYAIQSIRDFKAEAALPRLCELLGSEGDGTVLSNVIIALEAIGKPAAVPALIEATRHVDPFVRYDSSRVLGVLRDARARPALEALLSDEICPREVDKIGLTVKQGTMRICDQARESLARLRRR